MFRRNTSPPSSESESGGKLNCQRLAVSSLAYLSTLNTSGTYTLKRRGSCELHAMTTQEQSQE
jgi:hypothetical protein